MPKDGTTTLPPPRRAAFIVRFRAAWSILIITVLSVAISVGVTQLLLIPMPVPTKRLAWAVHLISIAVPLFIAPPTVWLVRGLLLHTEAARREAEQLATTDALTGVWNRRHFFALAESELARAAVARDGVALLLLDLDHFKSVNDTYGHAAGDDVLKAVTACCSQRLRPYDMLARLGGEEFVILLSAVDEGQAAHAAERVRSGVQALVVEVAPGTIVRPTTSIGISSSRTDGDTLDSLLDAADRAMYAAKQGGRNRVCRAVPLPERTRRTPEKAPDGVVGRRIEQP